MREANDMSTAAVESEHARDALAETEAAQPKGATDNAPSAQAPDIEELEDLLDVFI